MSVISEGFSYVFPRQVVMNKGGWRSKEDEDAVSFYMNVLMAAWNIEFAFVLQASWERKEVKRRNGVMRELR